MSTLTHFKSSHRRPRSLTKQPTQAQIIQSEYQDVLQRLQALTHQHEKTYRLKVGELILQRFFGGSAAEFSSNEPTKNLKFKHFVAVHASDIADLDLPEQTLRRCVRVKLCHDSLPPAAREQLGGRRCWRLARLAR